MIAMAVSATAPALGAAQGMPAGETIAWAVALLLLAAGLAITELLLVSWGALLVGSLICAVASVTMAFSVSNLAGWIFIVLVPVLGTVAIRIGLKLMRRNSAIVQRAEIVADAGYHHLTESVGVGIGAIGELTTEAFPTGRARFAGSKGPVQLDVQVQGRALPRGERVVVLAINGPVVVVGQASDNMSGLMTNPPPNPSTNPKG